MKCIKAKVSDLQDPKRLAVLKAIVGSPCIRYSGDNGNLLGFIEGFLVSDKFKSFLWFPELLIPIPTMKINGKELIFEGIDSESYRYHKDLKYNQWQSISSLRMLIQSIKKKDEFRIKEEVLKELGFEIMEVKE